MVGIDIFTVEDVMAAMKWSDRNTVYRQVKAGRLKPVPNLRPLRFTRESLLRFINGDEEQPTQPRRRMALLPDVPRTTKRTGSKLGLIGQ